MPPAAVVQIDCIVILRNRVLQHNDKGFARHYSGNCLVDGNIDRVGIQPGGQQRLAGGVQHAQFVQSLAGALIQPGTLQRVACHIGDGFQQTLFRLIGVIDTVVPDIHYADNLLASPQRQRNTAVQRLKQLALAGFDDGDGVAAPVGKGVDFAACPNVTGHAFARRMAKDLIDAVYPLAVGVEPAVRYQVAAVFFQQVNPTGGCADRMDGVLDEHMGHRIDGAGL